MIDEENNQRRLKITIFTENFYPGTGGAEKAVECLGNSFVDLGHDVMICAPKYWDCEERGKYICNRTKSIKVGKNSFLPRPNQSKEFKKKLDDFKPDLIHCNGNNAMLSFAIKYGKAHNIPIIYTAHTKLKMYVQSKLHSKILASLFARWVGKRINQCTYVTAVSRSMKGEFLSYGYTKDFGVIKNGSEINTLTLDEETKSMAREKYNIKDDDNVLLFVGHIESCKNIDFIFEALMNLFEKRKDFKMFFVGSIDEKRFQKKVEKSIIGKNVFFTGQITDKRLLAFLYSNAKLFLFPSIFDNDSLAILESAMYGVPSIVLKDTGSSERITNDFNGFIIKTPDDMALKIDCLLSDKEKIVEVGRNANKTLIQNWNDVAAKYIDLFNKILNKEI